MLALAIAAGFRESGILLGRRTILGIRTTANSLEFPLAEDNHLLVSKEYLDYIVNMETRSLKIIYAEFVFSLSL